MCTDLFNSANPRTTIVTTRVCGANQIIQRIIPLGIFHPIDEDGFDFSLHRLSPFFAVENTLICLIQRPNSVCFGHVSRGG